MIIIFIMLLAAFNVTVIDYFVNNPDYYNIGSYTYESDDFRAMRFGEEVCKMKKIDAEWLTQAMTEYEFDLSGYSNEEKISSKIMDIKPVEYKKLLSVYDMLLKDLKYFPIPDSTDEQTAKVYFENDWQNTRTYGGNRGHEGCDIMGNQMERGTYPVISMTDGIIENAGWLEKGGWRLGIRSPSGVYFYYAHLYSYSKEWVRGDEVKAGELIGFMGDTGYSMVEGTTGNFDVHLHLGMYIKTENYEEMSVNPYWFLKYMEKYKLKYSY